MAVKKITTKSTNTKNGTKTVKKIKDTSLKTGRQQNKQSKTIGTHATAITGEIVSGEVAKNSDKERTKRHIATANANAYQAAINKWNGILKSTPEAAEGTNEPIQGNLFGSNTTGDNDKFTGGLG